ncbi:MAG: CotH kinase family protein, partial [Muribaculaceae bacterium]|nr:CotH kinase family protein [Muribaculaceae bacterium]
DNIVSNIIIIDNNTINIAKDGTIRERGNGSRAFPKKPWRIKFDKKQNVLDAPAKVKKWTLINNYGDKTLMRNLVAFEIARRVGMKWVPWSRPVDVILNGEYKGCYQLTDQVEVNPGRLEITEMEATDITGDALTGGYLFEIDAYASQEPAGSWFTSTIKQIPVTIKSPDDGGTAQQLNYIKKYFNNLESKLYSVNFTNPGTDYRDISDVNSFVQHFIVNELAGNTDTYWSTYMYKDRLDPIIYTGPVWDFDLGFDNDGRTYPIHSHAANDFLYRYGGSSAANNMKWFADRVLKFDTRSKADIQRIWSIARNDHDLSYESLIDYIDEMADEIDESQKLNFVRWPILNSFVHENPRALGSFEKEVTAMKDYLKVRFNDLDRLYNYDATISGIDEIITDAESSIFVSDNMIVNRGDETYAVYTITGNKIYEGVESTDRLSSGIYIVVSPAGTFKVMIK